MPNWASFFKQKEYDSFIQHVEDYFNSIKIPITITDGSVTATKNDFGFDQMGLSNIAQVCKHHARSGWKELIRDHFESLQRAQQFDKEFQTKLKNFESIRNYLGVRLLNTEVIDARTESFFVKKDFLPDVFSMLCYDLPDNVRNVKPEDARAWESLTTDELFSIGEANIKNNYSFDLSREKLDEFSLWICQDTHFFVPNLLLDIDSHPQCMGKLGCLVGIPTRHFAFFYPIEDLEVVKTIMPLIGIASGMHRDGPGSLTSSLYWYYEGRFENLPYQFKENGKEVSFIPSDRFIGILNQLESPGPGAT